MTKEFNEMTERVVLKTLRDYIADRSEMLSEDGLIVTAQILIDDLDEQLKETQ